METKLELFGRPIFSPGKLSLTEQVYDIICEEIHAGHWKTGERLPSIAVMANESGLSRRPVQQAIDRLCAKGYLRAEHGSGTFLESILPKGRVPQGAIGIIMLRRGMSDANGFSPFFQELDQWRLHAILQEATEHNYTEEVKFFEKSYDGVGIDTRGGLFSDRVKGIICLHGFPRRDKEILTQDDIPFVSLGVAGFPGTPCVALDLVEGFSKLTQEVIVHGHRNIVCAGYRFDLEGETNNVFSGYRRAMEGVGFTPRQEAFAESLDLVSHDVSQCRQFLERHAMTKGDGPVTALVCATSELAAGFIAAADMMGIRVPENLSVVSLLAGPMRLWKPDQVVTGIEYDVEYAVRLCFQMLDEQMRTRRNYVSMVRLKPCIRMGCSLAAPGKGAQTVSSGESAEKKNAVLAAK